MHPIFYALDADMGIDCNLAEAHREIRQVLKHDLVPNNVNEATDIVHVDTQQLLERPLAAVRPPLPCWCGVLGPLASPARP